MGTIWILVCVFASIVQAQNPGPFFPGGINPFARAFEDTEVHGDEIPGVAGVDYPVFAQIPPTSFSCDNWPVPGYYADPDSGCQVFYVCQESGRGRPFLCPNGTIFNQQHLVCDWWYNFDCSRATQFYGVNEENQNEADSIDAANPISKINTDKSQSARGRQLNYAARQRQFGFGRKLPFPNRGFSKSFPLFPSGTPGLSEPYSGKAEPSTPSFDSNVPESFFPGGQQRPGENRNSASPPFSETNQANVPTNYPSSSPFSSRSSSSFPSPQSRGKSLNFGQTPSNYPYNSGIPPSTSYGIPSTSGFQKTTDQTQSDRGRLQSGYAYPSPNPSFNYDRPSDFSKTFSAERSYLPPNY